MSDTSIDNLQQGLALGTTYRQGFAQRTANTRGTQSNNRPGGTSMATERPSGLKQRSYLIGGDEINWLETAAGKTKLTQSDLVRLALQRLRKDLGAARSLKLEAVETLAKGTRWAPVKRGGPRRRAS